MRKFGSAALVIALATLAPITIAYSAKADDPAPVATATTMAAPVASGQRPPRGDDHGRPLHRIDEERDGGFEKVQLIFVGAAIVVAIGLAYRAGRRRRDA